MINLFLAQVVVPSKSASWLVALERKSSLECLLAETLTKSETAVHSNRMRPRCCHKNVFFFLLLKDRIVDSETINVIFCTSL